MVYLFDSGTGHEFIVGNKTGPKIQKATTVRDFLYILFRVETVIDSAQNRRIQWSGLILPARVFCQTYLKFPFDFSVHKSP